ncbi:cytochrome c553 [Neorhizobium galegae]|uniref:c-type cytochrome n=1 Tax=Neorhizobium galegae TaxID=399 RepID=UPI001AE15014|nr:c-type cytochrome [Neorhizobium galegae]MBP2549890.1 cytochrome c553 [Neorhizobium galegae]
MYIRWKYLIAAVIVAPVLALLVAWSGLINIGARSGHWAVTDWFLHWSMQSSVRTASVSTEVPPFDNPEMLKLAAGHYEAGCAMCHGSPARERSSVVFGMLPVPPDLKPRIPTWTDAELFHIVDKGVRFTGMPAWAAEHRPDEVWSMVAFLRRMPNMDAAEYQRLAGLAASSEGGTAQLGCQSCHDEDRLNGRSLIPSLAGQSPDYLRKSLMAYLKGERASGVMQTAVNGLNADQVAALSAHYAEMPRNTLSAEEANPNGGNVEDGEKLARLGRPEDRIPACLSCHEKADGNPVYPTLSGQSAPYLARQLRLFREGHRGGTAFHHLMARAANDLTDKDVEDLAAYFAARANSR